MTEGYDISTSILDIGYVFIFEIACMIEFYNYYVGEK